MPSSLRQLARSFRSGTIPASRSSVTVARKTRYRPADLVRKEIVAGVRDGMKLIKKSAKRAEGAKLNLKRGSKTSRTIGTRVRASKTTSGIRARLFGSGWLNVWESGRKGYWVAPKRKKALLTPQGPRRMRIFIPAQSKRPVLEVAVNLHRDDAEKFVAARMEKAAAEGLSRTIKVRTRK